MKKRFSGVILLMAALSLFPYAPARGDSLMIPQGTERIEEEAFRDCAALTSLELPENLTTIGDRAFYGCGALKEVVCPGTLESIGEAAFDNCAEALYFICPPDSEAARWAENSGFDWNAGTTCRALVIGQTYPDTEFSLKGPATDHAAVAGCLGCFGRTSYTVTTAENLTSDGIISAVSTAFSGATKNDISLFFYAGHGMEGGYLLGSELGLLEPARLRNALDSIPGRKVIIIDACYSGALIKTRGGSKDGKEAADEFTKTFIQAFSERKRGVFTANDYYVIVACGEDEECREGNIYPGAYGSKQMGFFTYSLCRGLGWDGVYSVAGSMYADRNHDNAVTIDEAFQYAYDYALSKNSNQHAMVYPQNCNAFSPFRP